MENRRNIGVLAHVDAGKTTLCEQMLLVSGAIRKAGRVDDGTAHTDALPIERQRGISVRSAAACLKHGDTEIRIVDTPGHVDFSYEVESALLALDGAVLVVSAVEGVQAQTASIASALRAFGIPVVAFINKVDRAGADATRVLQQLSGLLPLPVPLWGGAEERVSALTLVDEELLALALEGTASEEDIARALAKACRQRKATPALRGAALRGEGVTDALDAIARCLPPPPVFDGRSIAAYHVARADDERQVSLRVFGGSLSIGETVGDGRVRRLKRLTVEGYVNVETLEAGDIGVAVGLPLRAGDWIGRAARGGASLGRPIYRAKLTAPDQKRLMEALAVMQDEQPTLCPEFEAVTRQVSVQVMGEVHGEIIIDKLKSTHGIAAELSPPTVLYRETPTRVGEGSFHLMGDSHFCAAATFRVEPGVRGSGVVYRSAVHTDRLYLQHQNDIETAVYECLREGVTGWPADDIVITLTDARQSTLKRPGSHFMPVVPLGVFEALKNAGMTLLEPILAFEAVFDSALVGRVLYDLTAMGAVTEPAVFDGELARLSGSVPAAASVRYPQTLRDMSRGKGLWRASFLRYDLCKGLGETRPRSTPDPGDRPVYLRHILGKMQG